METAVFLCLRKSILYCYRLQAAPPRPALNSSRCLLLPGLIRDSEKRQGEREMRGRRKEPWPQWTLCRRMWQEYQSSPTHPWALSTPNWFNTEIKMGGRASRAEELLYGFTVIRFSKGAADPSSLRSNTILSGKNLRLVRRLIVLVTEQHINSSIKGSYLNSFVEMYITLLNLNSSFSPVTMLGDTLRRRVRLLHWLSNQFLKCLRCRLIHLQADLVLILVRN